MLGGHGTFEFTDTVSLKMLEPTEKVCRVVQESIEVLGMSVYTYKPAFISISQLSGYK